MSTYEIKFTLSNGQTITVMTNGQPDDISEFLTKMTKTSYQSFVNDSDAATAVNLTNVLYFEAKKVRELR